MIQHPFEGVIDDDPGTKPTNALDAVQSRDVAPSSSGRRNMLQVTLAAFGAAATFLPGAAFAQQSRADEEGLSLESGDESQRSTRRSGGRQRGNRGDGEGDEANLQLETQTRGRRGRDHEETDDEPEMRYPEDYDEYERWRDRRDERRERRRDQRERERERQRDQAEWYDRLDTYYFGQNWWGPDYDRRRGRRRRYTTQALSEEGGRGGRGRGRYTTQSLGEEGGYRYRNRWYGRDRYREWYDRRNRWTNPRGTGWDGRQRRGDERDRNRGRYTTYALGEEG